MGAAEKRDRYRAIAYQYRNLPGKHGLREHTVSVVTATTDGTHVGDGAITETESELVERGGYPPKVRWLNDEEIALASGALGRGAVSIGPITPTFSGGGTSLSLVDGSTLSVDDVRLIRIVGPKHPSGADYRVKSISEDRALHLTVVAEPVASYT